MTSLRRRMANARNAQKSTGPRTPSGRAKSSRNALQHGLTARAETLSESWLQKATALAMDQRPHAPVDATWVAAVAGCLARLDQLRQMKVQSLTAMEAEYAGPGNRRAGATGLRAYSILDAYERRVRATLAKHMIPSLLPSTQEICETNPSSKR